MANIGRQQRSETRKPRILLSAAKLFLSNGYSKTTVKDIAKDAEATENSIYFLLSPDIRNNKYSFICKSLIL